MASEALNDTFGYGVAASRPAAGIPGRVYWASDTSVLSRDNGSSWDTLTPAAAASLTVEEVDGSPTDSAITKIKFPNGTLAIVSHVATYTPAAGGGGVAGFLPTQDVALNDTVSSASPTITIAAAASGHVLVLCSSRDNTGTITSISCTNVTWTKQVAYNANGPSIEIWTGVVAGGSSGTTITVNYSNSSFNYLSVSEWPTLTPTLDTSATSHDTAAMIGSKRRFPYILPTVANPLVIGCVAADNMSSPMTNLYGGLTMFRSIFAATTRAGHAAGFAFPGKAVLAPWADGGSSNNISAAIVSLT